MDDSRVALNKAYSAVRERYNKLRLQYRQLLKDRTCLQCQQQLNATVENKNSTDKQATRVVNCRSLSDASEIHEICEQLKQIAVADSCCAIETVIPRLQNVASRMATSAHFEHQESLLHASAQGVSPSLDALSDRRLGASVTDTCSNSLHSDLLQSQQVEIDATVMGTTADFKTCEMPADSDNLDKKLTAGRLVT